LRISKICCTFAADFALMSEQTHTIIDLKRLPTGTHRFDIQLDNDFFASVEKSEILSGEVSASAVLNLREEDYQLTITVHGTVFVVCDRCLDPMAIEIDANDGMMECSNDEMIECSNDGMMECSNDGMMECSNDGMMECSNDGSIDLTWLAYEIVSINIPIVHCHQPGECNKQMELLLHDHLCDEPEPEDN